LAVIFFLMFIVIWDFILFGPLFQSRRAEIGANKMKSLLSLTNQSCETLIIYWPRNVKNHKKAVPVRCLLERPYIS
jgi:hypothetical protein